MATEAQINANRQNAEKSTGPRTAEGKAAVAQNALKHGLLASPTVINGEDQAAFDLYRQAMLAEMGPVGMMESSLAERVASLKWRLRRAERIQDQALKMQISSDRLDLVVRQVQWSYREAKGLPQEESQPKDAAWGIRRVCWECADETDLARAAIILGDWFGVVSFGPIAVGPLVDVLLDGDTELGQSVVQTLNEIRSDVALAALLQALRDSQQDVTIRQLIASLLGTRDDSQSLTALVNSLGDESWPVRVAAVTALEKREWLPTLPEEKALVAILHKDWDQISKIGEASIAALTGSLGYYTVGAEAAQALLALGTPGCDALVHALNNCEDNPTVREVASMALAECGDERAIKPLQSMLKGPDIAVRQFAVWTLERLGWEPTSKSEQATAALAHGDWDGLRKLGASAVEPLLQMVTDSMARDETVATLDHILDIVPGRISIRQLQKLVSLDEIRPEYGTVPQTQTDGSAKEQDGLGRVQKRAQRELLRRGILR